MSKVAVISSGGKQYVVSEGDVVTLEKISDAPEKGGKFTINEVLMVDSGSAVTVGTPTVKGAKVTAEVIEHGRHKKVVVIHYRQKSRYFKKNGHRQPFTKVRIAEIA